MWRMSMPGDLGPGQLLGQIKSLRRWRLWLLAAVTMILTIVPAVGSESFAYSPTVYVFPTPGSRVVLPGAQITFRGVPANRIGSITVTGSHSGGHTGKGEGDSDGHGGSFLPAQ